MKPILIRILSIVMLTIATSAFALPEKAKSPANPNSNNATASAPDTRGERKADEKSQEKSPEQILNDQEKQWLRDVENIVSG